VGINLTGSNLESFLVDGGWTVEGDYAAASAMTGTSLIDGEFASAEIHTNADGIVQL